MMNAYDLSYSAAHQHIDDLRREAAARRLVPTRRRRRRTLLRLGLARPWVSSEVPGRHAGAPAR